MPLYVMERNFAEQLVEVGAAVPELSERLRDWAIAQQPSK